MFAIWLPPSAHLIGAHSIVGDNNPLPPPASKEEDDEALFDDDPWVEPPFRIDYGSNLRLGKNVYINFNCVVIDTCVVSIGARTLLAPNVSLYSGTHPLDPDLRNGTQGPESGKPITIEEDVWIGGDVVVLPGVVVGRGSVVGAGSVVTKVSRDDEGVLASDLIGTDLDPECGTVHCSCGQSSEIYQRRSARHHYPGGERADL